MNWVPLLFIDDLCHQLPSSSLKPVSELSGSWAKLGSQHCVKRREFSFGCRMNDHECDYFIENREGTIFFERVTLCELNLDYDRFTISAYNSTGSESYPLRISVSEDELPTIASLVSNCSWPHLHPHPKCSAHNEMLFKAFKNCPGFNEIEVHDDELSWSDFVERQVELGNVESITLNFATARKWIEPEKLASTLKQFVRSSRFRELIVFDLLPFETFELFELFLERAIAGELKEGARIVITIEIDFDMSRLSALHPEHREDSEELGWRIPNSNRRISENQSDSNLYYLGCFVLRVL